MIPSRFWLLFLTLAVAFSGLSAVPLPQSEDGIFIKETGHWITGEFYDFWQDAPDPTLLFGFPITEAIPHPLRHDMTVQYFQRARMELDPSRPEGQRIQLASLGSWLYDETARGDLAGFPMSNAVCRVFQSTRKTVCYAFLQLYDRLEGPVYFGEPISEAEIVNGRLVQYFERARMEWRPERPVGQRVVLTEIGRLDFDITIGNPNLIDTYGDIPASALTEMEVHVFAEKPIVPTGARQKVNIIIYDQFHQPLEGAQVMVTVTYPDGRTEKFRPSRLTNAKGLATAVFNIEQVKPNQVIEVTVDASIANGPTGQSSTWFRTWW